MEEGIKKANESQPIYTFPTGSMIRITNIALCNCTKRKLLSFGLEPGATAIVNENEGSNFMVSVNGYEVTLTPKVAAKVKAELA